MVSFPEYPITNLANPFDVPSLHAKYNVGKFGILQIYKPTLAVYSFWKNKDWKNKNVPNEINCVRFFSETPSSLSDCKSLHLTTPY